MLKPSQDIPRMELGPLIYSPTSATEHVNTQGHWAGLAQATPAPPSAEL